MKSQQKNALKTLSELLKKEDTILCTLKSVTRSGMSRRIDFGVIKDGDYQKLTGLIASAIGLSYTSKDWAANKGLRVDGCGMDMGFHVVNNLSMAIFCPDGYTHEGAYALKHRWI